MVKRTGTTNDNLKILIRNLKKDEKPLWKRVAKELNKPTRIRREVDLSRINRNTKSGEIIIIPGKVLGSGELTHKLTISALNFTEQALKKIKESGSEALTLNELYTKGKIGRIIG